MGESEARNRRPKPADGGRLDASDWILAGLGQLAEQGIGGVKIETLARRLKVTKGSFYWHFKDRDAFLAAMLTDWRRRATLDIIDRLDRSDEPATERLIKLFRLPLTGKASEWGADVELSIRLWGRQDGAARAALAEVDAVRLRYIRGLLEASGVERDEAEARAILGYAYMRVAATLITGADADLIRRCEAVLFR